MKQYIIPILIILVVVGIYVDFRGKYRPSDTIIQSDTIVVNLPPITFDFPPSEGIKVYNQLPTITDSAQIARDYYATVSYNDSIIGDSVSLWLSEVVSQNVIQSRKMTYKLNIPVSTTITNIHEDSRRKLLIGGMVGYGADRSLDLTAQVGYMDKRDRVLMGGYNFVDKSYNVGIMWTVKLR